VTADSRSLAHQIGCWGDFANVHERLDDCILGGLVTTANSLGRFGRTLRGLAWGFVLSSRRRFGFGFDIGSGFALRRHDDYY